MAGFLSYSLAGTAFLLISALESLPLPPSLPPSLPLLLSTTLSLLTAANSLLSSFPSSPSDPIGPSLPLSTLPVSALFLLHSLSSLTTSFPPPLLHLLSLAAFSQELLLFRLRTPKDSAGLENRYFDLLLLPILLCAASSLAAIARPTSPFPRLARAAGLALHGSWLIQMAFSLFTSFVAHGCALHRRSRANFTVACARHEDIHRASAIATLQFNLHLAGLVVLAVGLCAVFNKGGRGREEYRPIGKQMRRLEHVSDSDFRLESDEDEEMSVPEKHDGET